MSNYDDIYSDEYICPKCKQPMDLIWDDENVDDYNFDGQKLVCTNCNIEMPFEAYGFSSQAEYESWFDETYERIYDDDDDDD